MNGQWKWPVVFKLLLPGAALAAVAGYTVAGTELPMPINSGITEGALAVVAIVYLARTVWELARQRKITNNVSTLTPWHDLVGHMEREERLFEQFANELKATNMGIKELLIRQEGLVTTIGLIAETLRHLPERRSG